MATEVQPDELSKIFQENVRRIRAEKGLSQSDVADRMAPDEKGGKVYAPYISDLENGKRAPLLGTLARLAEALETTVEALLSPPRRHRRSG